jgi:hypothetical protein
VAARREREKLDAEMARQQERQAAMDQVILQDKGYLSMGQQERAKQTGGAAVLRAALMGARDQGAIDQGLSAAAPQQTLTLGGQQFTRESPVAAAARAASRSMYEKQQEEQRTKAERQTAEDEQVKAFVAAGATEQQARAAVRGGAKYGDLFMSPAERSREKIALAQLGIDREKAKQTDTGKPRFGEVSSLRKEFNTESRPYKTINDALRNIEALGAKTNPTPQDDQALIYQFVKAQDPTSVVRESEYANAANAIALTDRITSYAQRLQTGQKLTPTQRADMVRTARSLREEAMNQYRTLADSYESLATSFNMDPKSIVANRLDRGFTAAKEAGKPSAKEALAKRRGGN